MHTKMQHVEESAIAPLRCTTAWRKSRRRKFLKNCGSGCAIVAKNILALIERHLKQSEGQSAENLLGRLFFGCASMERIFYFFRGLKGAITLSNHSMDGGEITNIKNFYDSVIESGRAN